MNSFLKNMLIGNVADREELSKGKKEKLINHFTVTSYKLVPRMTDAQLEATFREAWIAVLKLDARDGMLVLSVFYNELIDRGYKISVSQLPSCYSPKDIKEYREKEKKKSKENKNEK
jgi:hypothetical protein